MNSKSTTEEDVQKIIKLIEEATAEYCENNMGKEFRQTYRKIDLARKNRKLTPEQQLELSVDFWNQMESFVLLKMKHRNLLWQRVLETVDQEVKEVKKVEKERLKRIRKQNRKPLSKSFKI
jgi:hypothetical protein